MRFGGKRPQMTRQLVLSLVKRGEAPTVVRSEEATTATGGNGRSGASDLMERAYEGRTSRSTATAFDLGIVRTKQRRSGTSRTGAATCSVRTRRPDGVAGSFGFVWRPCSRSRLGSGAT